MWLFLTPIFQYSIFTYLLWPLNVPSFSTQFDSFLCVCSCACVVRVSSFLPQFLPQGTFWPNTYFSQQQQAGRLHTTPVSVPLALIFPTPSSFQAPFPLSQSVLPDLAVIFVSKCLECQEAEAASTCFSPGALCIRIFPSVPVCFLTEVVSYA